MSERQGGWADLGDRAVLRATGKDRARFLNGMLTSDIARLAAGAYVPALLLDRKGHVISEGTAIAEPEALWLDMSPGTGAEVLQILERHLIADDVALEDCSAGFAQISLEGAAGRAYALGLGLPTPERGAHAAGPGGLRVLGEGWLTPDGVRLLGPRDALPRPPAGQLAQWTGEALERARIEHFVPRYGRDLGPRSFPQEARLERALSFTKGCYLGQEIVARIQSRGAVNRLLVQLACQGPASEGDVIAREGSSVGAVTSAAEQPGQGWIALGYVKKDHAAPGTELQIGSARARVVGPPL